MVTHWIASLACDYDGTLAHDGVITAATLAALDKFIASGRKLIMVTGRELHSLKSTCAYLDRFELIVAENGGLLYDPATDSARDLGPPPPEKFLALLREKGVPLSVGASIVATWTPYETVVLQAIKELGLELHVIFNKGAVMILPSGINKSTGLQVALEELSLSRHNVLGIGDAENDHAFLEFCHAGIAVSNALPLLKERADYVTKGDHGAGVSEVIDRILDADVQFLLPHLGRRGFDHHSKSIEAKLFGPYEPASILFDDLADGSIGVQMWDELIARHYQVVLFDLDPGLEVPKKVQTLGSIERGPSEDDLMSALKQAEVSICVSLESLAAGERLHALEALLNVVRISRAENFHPHYVMIRGSRELIIAGSEAGVNSGAMTTILTSTPFRFSVTPRGVVARLSGRF